LKKTITVVVLGLTLTLTSVAFAKSVKDINPTKTETTDIPLSETFLEESEVDLIMQSIKATNANYSCPSSDYTIEFKVEKSIQSQDHLYLGLDGKVKQTVKQSGEFSSCTENQLTVLGYCVEPTCIFRESVPAQVIEN
jgi:hypothetical protein